MRTYSLDLRNRIVRAVQNGKTKTETAQIYEVSLSTVKRFCKRQQATGDLTPLPKPGRTPLIQPGNYENLAHQMAQEPDALLSVQCKKWEERTHVKVSRSTLSRTLARMGWSRKKKV